MIKLEILNEDYSKLPYAGRHDNSKSIYELVMQIDGIDFRVSWTSNNFPPIKHIIVVDNKTVNDKTDDSYNGEFGKMKKLSDLKNFIREIIIEREEYKRLPPHTMYL